jgi:hypothetical protein
MQQANVERIFQMRPFCSPKSVTQAILLETFQAEKTKMKIIAYFLYGNRSEYKLELALSVISAIGQEKIHADENTSEKITYCVITDQEDIGYPLPVEILRLEPGELARWTDNGTYNHRAKPSALLKALEHYKCPVAMIDTDTYFTKSPQKIFDDIDVANSVMHDFEYLIGNTPLWAPLLQKIDGQICINGYTTDSKSPMFNSGVIGLAIENKHLLADALEINDGLYKITPIFNIEQFALGLALSTKTKLHICNQIVRHYWGMDRDFVRIQAARFLEDFSETSINEKIAAVVREKFGHPSIPSRFKLIAWVLYFWKGWSREQKFAYICRLCERYYLQRDIEYSQAWGVLAKAMAR